MNLRVGDYVTWEKPHPYGTGLFRYVARVDEICILNGEVAINVTRLCGKTAMLRMGECARLDVAPPAHEGFVDEKRGMNSAKNLADQIEAIGEQLHQLSARRRDVGWQLRPDQAKEMRARSIRRRPS